MKGENFMFEIRERSSGKIAARGYNNREEGKPERDALNKTFYGKNEIPPHNRQYYIVRSYNHRRGVSK